MNLTTKGIRKTSQFLMPLYHRSSQEDSYDIYPVHNLSEGKIFEGFASLADAISEHSLVIIDGYQGVLFEDIVSKLTHELQVQGKIVSCLDVGRCLQTPDYIHALIAPFLGGDDPVFGTRATIKLIDFFDQEELQKLKPDASADITIIYGVGASLANSDGLVVYVDLPKNELQFRARASACTNLGADSSFDAQSMYKRFYFVDWVVLNRHKEIISADIDIMVDGQYGENITWVHGENIRKSLKVLAQNVFRVRPWFEPGVWGGKWCMQHIEGLNKDVPNYAWSFELITPENGIVFESNGLRLEVSFDFIMYSEGQAVLGKAFGRFGVEFPIRFDFLDTFDGGNLSVQCHPKVEYIKTHFGENFTQEETYYILDAAPDATVYLGFQEDIDPRQFRETLEQSFQHNQPIDIENFVQKLPARRHDLFLIPPGTIHASGKNNLVLEISATPYIFTFKMYDWVRPDMHGKPRPLNIARGFDNLEFNRKGQQVHQELISQPLILQKNDAWTLYHLPTHKDHLYDVHRISLRTHIDIETDGQCHVLSLVEGKRLRVETLHGMIQYFNYAETFVIPADAQRYTLINESQEEILIIKAFVK
jgi:mannose-6-phosphate isomerase class I